MNHDNLSNQFLIAMPKLQDRYFGGAVVYICRHCDEGTLGVVTNRPMDLPMFEVFEQLGLEDERPYPARQTVVQGGPVEGDKGFIIHDGEQLWESSVALEDGLKRTTSRDILQDIAANYGPANYLLALGCAGWAPGQLEQEIMDNSWLVCPADHNILFSEDYASMVDLATAQMGFHMDQLGPTAGYS